MSEPTTRDPGEPILKEPTEPILQYFAYKHLPPHLQQVSAHFADLAQRIMNLPRSPERTVALRKLLESKDAAVRAALSATSPMQQAEAEGVR